MRRSHLENGNPKDESTPLVFFHGPLNIDSSFRRHLKNLKERGEREKSWEVFLLIRIYEQSDFHLGFYA